MISRNALGQIVVGGVPGVQLRVAFARLLLVHRKCSVIEGSILTPHAACP
jgi:hypothetical protein